MEGHILTNRRWLRIKPKSKQRRTKVHFQTENEFKTKGSPVPDKRKVTSIQQKLNSISQKVLFKTNRKSLSIQNGYFLTEGRWLKDKKNMTYVQTENHFHINERPLPEKQVTARQHEIQLQSNWGSISDERKVTSRRTCDHFQINRMSAADQKSHYLTNCFHENKMSLQEKGNVVSGYTKMYLEMKTRPFPDVRKVTSKRTAGDFKANLSWLQDK